MMRASNINLNGVIMNLIKFSLKGFLAISLLQSTVYAVNSTDENIESDTMPVALKATGMSSNWIGVGVGYTHQPYRDWNESEMQLYPFITYYYESFFIDGDSLGYTLYSEEINGEGFYINLIANISQGGYEENDSPFFVSMADRDDIAVELGFSTGFITPVGFFEFSTTQDVANAHGGYIVDLAYSIPLSGESETFQLMPYLGVTYYSDDYNDFYYGVRENEATITRLAYKSKGGVNFYTGMGLSYQINNRWSLLGDVGYQKLNSHIKDSPIVIKDNIISVLLGVGYSF